MGRVAHVSRAFFIQLLFLWKQLRVHQLWGGIIVHLPGFLKNCALIYSTDWLFYAKRPDFLTKNHYSNRAILKKKPGINLQHYFIAKPARNLFLKLWFLRAYIFELQGDGRFSQFIRNSKKHFYLASLLILLKTTATPQRTTKFIQFWRKQRIFLMISANARATRRTRPKAASMGRVAHVMR